MSNAPKTGQDRSAQRALQETIRKAGEQDERRQQQIANQVEIINRLKGEVDSLKAERVGTNIVMGILVQRAVAWGGRSQVSITQQELEAASGVLEVEQMDDGSIVLRLKEQQ